MEKSIRLSPSKREKQIIEVDAAGLAAQRDKPGQLHPTCHKSRHCSNRHRREATSTASPPPHRFQLRTVESNGHLQREQAPEGHPAEVNAAKPDTGAKHASKLAHSNDKWQSRRGTATDVARPADWIDSEQPFYE